MSQVHNAIRHHVALLSGYARALGESADFSGIERAGETLTPIIDLWSRPEWAILRGELLGAMRLSQPAVAAEFGWVALVNPTGSRHIVVLEGLSASSATTLQYSVIYAVEAALAASVDAVVPGNRRDRRFDPSAAFETLIDAQRGGGAGALSGQVPETMRALASTNVVAMIPPIVIPPGHTIAVQAGTVNVELSVNFRWRERRAFPDELD